MVVDGSLIKCYKKGKTGTNVFSYLSNADSQSHSKMYAGKL